MCVCINERDKEGFLGKIFNIYHDHFCTRKSINKRFYNSFYKSKSKHKTSSSHSMLALHTDAERHLRLLEDLALHVIRIESQYLCCKSNKIECYCDLGILKICSSPLISSTLKIHLLLSEFFTMPPFLSDPMPYPTDLLLPHFP